jgi:pentose-5-phosphate-3-epimerase
MIIPAILENNKESLIKRVNQVKSFSRKVHIDIMDQTLTDQRTLSISDIPLDLPVQIELHLMVTTPSLYLESIKNLNPYKLIIHSESDIFEKEVNLMRNFFNIYAGVNINTPVDEVISIKEKLAGVLLMSVNMGASGKNFNIKVLDKVKEVSQYFSNIQLDGGINEENLSICKSLGVKDFAIHTTLFSSPNIEDEFLKLKEL